MRGVLVDEDDAGRGLRDDVGPVQLRARGAEPCLCLRSFLRRPQKIVGALGERE